MIHDMAEGAANLTIGQVAERTGLSVHALRYDEREGRGCSNSSVWVTPALP
jgi:hypothetical protein